MSGCFISFDQIIYWVWRLFNLLTMIISVIYQPRTGSQFRRFAQRSRMLLWYVKHIHLLSRVTRPHVMLTPLWPTSDDYGPTFSQLFSPRWKFHHPFIPHTPHWSYTMEARIFQYPDTKLFIGFPFYWGPVTRWPRMREIPTRMTSFIERVLTLF